MNHESGKQFHTALIIGRFQPLHKGHIFLIKKAAEMADKVVIVVGSANKQDQDNPFSVEERRKMISKMLKDQRLDQIVKKILSVDDIPDNDDKWLQVLLSKTGPIDIVIGNNDWVNGIFKKAGYQVLPILLYKRHLYEGKKIREDLREKGKLV